MHRKARTRGLRKAWVWICLLLVLPALSACGTAESPSSAVAAPSPLDASIAQAQAHAPIAIPLTEEASAFMPQEGYNRLLVRAYGDLAEKAFREMDWVDGYRFNRKAELAARSEKTQPDTPESRSIAVARDPDIRRAYVTLRNYLEPGNFSKSPEQIALAQAAYDCWVEDAEESLVEMRQGICRKQFEDAIAKVERVMIDDALDTIEAPADAVTKGGKKPL